MKKLFLFASFAICSINLLTAQIILPAPYCDASFDDMQGFPVDDHISNVSFGNLSNTSNAQYAAPHYVFYNNLSTNNYIKGNAYSLSVTFNVSGGCGYGVWIDYNHNNTFDAIEKIAGTTGTNMMNISSATVITQSITIPTSALTGNTRMRVRIVEDDNYNMTTTSELPCNASTSDTDIMDWGETEDYTINITTASGINDITNTPNIFMYPNPTFGQFTIQSPVEIIGIQVINMLDQQVAEETGSNQKELKMNVSLEPGIYMVVVKTEQSKYIEKITITR